MVGARGEVVLPPHTRVRMRAVEPFPAKLGTLVVFNRSQTVAVAGEGGVLAVMAGTDVCARY